MLSNDLKSYLIGEFKQILESLVHSRKLFEEGRQMVGKKQVISEEMMRTYMRIKRKKMNVSMMVFTDCISLEGNLDKSLIQYIENMGKICELRAVAYKDL